MLVAVYCETDTLPPNRGALFERFIKMLLARERLADPDTFEVSIEGSALLKAIGELAWQMMQHLPGDQRQQDVQIAIDKNEIGLEEQQLKRAASASILETGAQIRFSHQLLQEYFVALGMRERLQRGELDATELWPADRWWERSGWEEATVLLAGLYAADCTPVIDWLRTTQPEVAAQCINECGAKLSDKNKTLEQLRTIWLPRLTDIDKEPHPYARAALGRALGSLKLDDRPLDNRPGVWGVYLANQKQVVVDIDWVERKSGSRSSGLAR
jgi:hypothetical protein